MYVFLTFHNEKVSESFIGLMLPPINLNMASFCVYIFPYTCIYQNCYSHSLWVTLKNPKKKILLLTYKYFKTHLHKTKATFNISIIVSSLKWSLISLFPILMWWMPYQTTFWSNICTWDWNFSKNGPRWILELGISSVY